MARSLKKGPYIDKKLIEKIKKTAPDSKTIIKTWARDCTIVPEMIGRSINVHNGKDFITVKISEEMVGHRLGEFSPTTKFVRHGGKMQRDLEAKTEARALPQKETAGLPKDNKK